MPNRSILALIVIGAALLLTSGNVPADGYVGAKKQFTRIATLANCRNNADIGDSTVSEIIAATQDGMTLVYTDSELEQIGFIDITDPAQPTPAGKLDVGGEPTSVDILRGQLALVAVNTIESFTDTSGTLVVVDIAKQKILVRELFGN